MGDHPETRISVLNDDEYKSENRRACLCNAAALPASSEDCAKAVCASEVGLSQFCPLQFETWGDKSGMSEELMAHCCSYFTQVWLHTTGNSPTMLSSKSHSRHSN